MRNLGDQPTEPAPTKSSPYHAAGGLPTAAEEQYYDASYDQTAGVYHNDGYGGGYDHAGYDHQAGGGYDHQTGYDQLGYDHTGYGHAGEYAQSQVSGGSQVGGYGGGSGGSQVGGYGGSQVGGGYGGSQVGGGYGGSQVGGYAQSNVGGGYQHQGYDEYGRR